jgi:hypothetical protein
LGQKSLRRKELRQKEFSRFLAISAPRKRANFGSPKPLFWRQANWPLLLEMKLSFYFAKNCIAVILEFMFPNSDCRPAHCAERTHNSRISLSVSFNFCRPKLSVSRWNTPTASTAMPKTSVQENG